MPTETELDQVYRFAYRYVNIIIFTQEVLIKDFFQSILKQLSICPK